MVKASMTKRASRWAKPAGRWATKKGKEFLGSKSGKKMTQNLKTELTEAARQKLADTPMAGVLGICIKMAENAVSPKLVNGQNLNETKNRDVTVPGAALGDITTSASMYMYRPHRKRTIEGVNYIQKTRSTGTFATSADQQGTMDLSILDAVPVSGNPDSNDKYSNLTLKKAFDDFLVAKNLPTASGSNADALKRQQTSIHMKSLTSELTLTNANSTPCVVDIYELLPKHTLGPSNYSNATYADGYMSPLWAWNVGLDTDTPQLKEELTYYTLGSSPYDSVVFSRTWNEVKRVRVTLTGNSSHIHKSAYAINKTVSYQEYAQFSTSGGKLAGWNPSYLMVVKGMPTTDNPLGGNANVVYSCNMQLNYSGHMSEGAKAIVFDDKT